MEIKGFIRGREDLENDKRSRKEIRDKAFPFGINFIDKATYGIFPHDLILITAKTGAGKTEIASQIVQNVLEQGRRVAFFALEAYAGEIMSRLKFKKLANAFYQLKFSQDRSVRPNYARWVAGRQYDLFKNWEPEIDQEMLRLTENLYMSYREGSFSPADFCEFTTHIAPEVDLIVLDHIHFFDFDTDNENKAMKETMGKIRDLSMIIGKPIVLVAHIRKGDKKSSGIIPTLDDIHGSSDISKIATKAIALASAANQYTQKDPHLHPTFIRVIKNRLDGSVCRYAAVVDFDISRNTYETNFILGTISYDDTEFLPLEGRWPQWALEETKNG
jgi:hypothetical protein